jgi:hypothetical protein
MAEETVEVRFLHHYTDRRNPEKPADHRPGDRASFPVPMARGLVASKVAEFATKKAERAADAVAS